ncbi:helix-turn-helix transcriptional regulator [Streptomyces galbus]|uniref:PAS domain-containing protein n=1 Tax=Streptomyces galbus TaxID=33898 RepID=A0A4U5X074_STRGB|nr:LuxR C-terminal-related transcriptional regulator [Streptomyces galbus]TKT08030.1 PAS domain-containing protein [Streptomyces galbus]GHD42325.1 hypothetical protein GCM10010335_45120 [Streptomyces galbus]
MATTKSPHASPRKDHPIPHPASTAGREPPPRNASCLPASLAICTVRAHSNDLIVTAAEPGFSRPFGLAVKDIYGRSLLSLLQSAELDRIKERLSSLSSGRTSRFTEEVTGKANDGGFFRAHITCVAATDVSGEVHSVVVLLCGPARAAGQDTALTDGGAPLLSALDARVLEGVAYGESTLQLASRLYLSRQGIEYRIGQMLRKFDTPNRPALVSRAHALGIFAAGQWPPRVRPGRIKP